ncbi:MAG: DUF559 domain-containing protein [Bacteroidales bacterium]|nr:DUF559 domain-containing protein [Bacteroidales bacterium]
MDRANNLQSLKDCRRELRKHSTVAEMALWNYLKGKQVEGLTFRRQFSVDNYILDFYCPALHLAVELDGEVHNQQLDYDRERSQYLQDRYGIKVLRFENRWVFEHLEWILGAIREEKARSRPAPPLS